MVRLGSKLTEETKKKMSLKHKGKIISLEQRKKISQTLKGRKVPKEVLSKRPKTQSLETRLKRSISSKGDKHYNWKGGITATQMQIRRSFEYRLWRESVFVRDNWTCVMCKARSSKGNHVYLEADHIKPFAYHPELRFNLENGRTLCVDCHKKTDTYGNKAREYQKTTELVPQNY